MLNLICNQFVLNKFATHSCVIFHIFQVPIQKVEKRKIIFFTNRTLFFSFAFETKFKMRGYKCKNIRGNIIKLIFGTDENQC